MKRIPEERVSPRIPSRRGRATELKAAKSIAALLEDATSRCGERFQVTSALTDTLKNFSHSVAAALIWAFTVIAGCELVSTIDEHERVVEGVSFTELFKSPSEGELAAVEADWASRNTNAVNIHVRKIEVIALGSTPATLQIVSHVVGGATHYGAIIAATGGDVNSRPVIVYAHGGDNGVDVDDEVLTVLELFQGISDEFVYVVPSYRSEELRYGGETWTSTGDPSPWDFDVDDTMALLSVADAISPSADVTNVSALGLSRGGGVALLLGIRDERVKQVIDFFGPTDFFGTYVQNIVAEALEGSLRDLPGLEYLDEAYIEPLKNGELTIADVRPELIRRSAVLFADRLPDVEIHHGTADETVDVSQAQSLIKALQADGRAEPGFEYYIYNGGAHNPFTLTGAFDRTAAFVGRLKK